MVRVQLKTINPQECIRNNITTVKQLSKHLQLSEGFNDEIAKILKRAPMSIPQYYLNLIDKDNPDDPIRKLCIPSPDELSMEGVRDTSGEKSNTILTGIQHKYQQTVLLLLTNRCAMYCRHCFRKRMVGTSEQEVMENFKSALELVKQDKTVTNVLVSGGDSLMLHSDILGEMLYKLSEVEHLNYIRIGSRIPVVMPERIIDDRRLLDIFKRVCEKKHLHLTTHFNSTHEFTNLSIEAINHLRESGVVVRNQTVLLNGVNSDPEELAAIQMKLIEYGIIPYYIFHCRPVRSTKHFQIPLTKGFDIVNEARAKMSGPAKTANYVMSHPEGKIIILGRAENMVHFKFHQAKNPEDSGRFFSQLVHPDQSRLVDTKNHTLPAIDPSVLQMQMDQTLIVKK